MFSKKDVLENLTKVTRKHLCQSLFFNKVVDQPVTLFKKDSGTGVFLDICEILKTTIFREHFRCLLLPVNSYFRQFLSYILTDIASSYKKWAVNKP